MKGTQQQLISLHIRSGEPNYYRGPHELCIIAGGPQNQQILS